MWLWNPEHWNNYITFWNEQTKEVEDLKYVKESMKNIAKKYSENENYLHT